MIQLKNGRLEDLTNFYLSQTKIRRMKIQLFGWTLFENKKVLQNIGKKLIAESIH